MDKELKVKISMYLGSEKEAHEVGEDVCSNLKGNQDFKDNNVVVNYTDDPGRVHIYIYEGTNSETVLQLLGC